MKDCIVIYEYECPKCDVKKEVCRSIRDDSDEHCQTCGEVMKRLISRSHFMGAKVEDAYFSHALGQVVRGDSHARQIAKSKGFEEVGNENPHKHLKPKLKDYMDEKSWQV